VQNKDMDSEQHIPGSDKLLPWPLKEKKQTDTKYTKYTKGTKYKIHIIKAP